MEVDKHEELLDNEEQEKLHSIVVKILWLEKRVRPDLKPCIALLSKRNGKFTLGDRKK